MSEVHRLVKILKEKGLTIALAESVTCGMAAYKLSNVKGISEVLKGAIVCYTPEVKRNLLGISKRMIDQYTCESMQVTEALAKNLHKIMPANIHIAVTGLASSDGSETRTKPVGSAFICITYKNKTYKYKHVFKGTPLQIKNKICIALYKFVRTTIS
jgi:nicotinamide-nucleotide amidase